MNREYILITGNSFASLKFRRVANLSQARLLAQKFNGYVVFDEDGYSHEVGAGSDSKIKADIDEYKNTIAELQRQLDRSLTAHSKDVNEMNRLRKETEIVREQMDKMKKQPDFYKADSSVEGRRTSFDL